MFVTHGWNAVVIFWVAIVAIVFIASFFGYRERASRHRMIETLAEKGQPIPPDYFIYSRRYWRYANPIASGIYLMCIGVALAVFLWALTGWGDPFAWGDRMYDGRPSWLPAVAIFPFMVGLARVLAGLFDRPPPHQ